MTQQWVSLEGKVAIVTGGSMGLGEAMVNELAANGAQVISLDVAANDAHKNQANVTTMTCDVSHQKEVAAVVKQIVDQYGHIDVLVNNAGVSRPRMLVDYYGTHPEYELSEDDFDFMTNINQKGVVFCAQAVARVMIKQKSGVIINMSSEAGLEGSKGQSCYSGNKAAVAVYTKAWAKELGQFNIRVVAVAPGVNERTPMNNDAAFKALAYTRGQDPNNISSDYKAIIPLGRPGKISEIADLITYLSSDHASYISGTTINITGAKSTR
ncbi:MULTISPECIES: sorbitol-6-phosphate dehydrogenase subunit [Lactobacillus]|uniref:sorbitol-6-phosphate dehydrogenase subunit n=1 Tax=Lactobacillus TaxID=1578 RepID=UPI000D700BD3|nr:MULTISPECIES: sorbitol-6-phosphate dehydrogenase subunit [Lactobacillus]AWN32813.1 sorbitol-6-phosphate 2-dehydrogenase [Lactobacillus helsingborgensis]RMC54445.1 SDR family NAD(P)-dependent oxidoreductase [Lactobacillus sp. ESL0262]